jgi:hypothetical protein
VKSYEKHVISCQTSSDVVGDRIKCQLCNFLGKTLSKHLTQTHKISKDDYLQRFPESSITSYASQTLFKKRGQNFAWLKRAKDRGDDLTVYKKKMGDAVRTSIMNNPIERVRRSEQMAINNRTPQARELSRNTAKKTSARPEILVARTARLARWRDTHFDEFYEKCIKAMHSTWHSKPELILFSLLSDIDGYVFKHNQVVKSEIFTNKSHRKQIDIADKAMRVYVEFDGIIHFEPRIKGEKALSDTKRMDCLLDEHVTLHNWTLIRISYDQFSYKDGGKFNEDCLRQLFELLKDPKSGVYRIGKAYETTSI